MRIIGGEHRGRRLLGPQSRVRGGRPSVTRPITDRVKQSLFDRLASMGALDGGTMIDIFAGTGSLGLEALSRGVERCVFIERDRSARHRLKQNLESLGLSERAVVLGVDALTTGWFDHLQERSAAVICCDPPYELTERSVSVSRVAQLIGALLTVTETDAVLMLRTSKRAVAPSANGWAQPTTHVYGSMALHFYHRLAGDG